jgi:hypothetical protein
MIATSMIQPELNNGRIWLISLRTKFGVLIDLVQIPDLRSDTLLLLSGVSFIHMRHIFIIHNVVVPFTQIWLIHHKIITPSFCHFLQRSTLCWTQKKSQNRAGHQAASSPSFRTSRSLLSYYTSLVQRINDEDKHKPDMRSRCAINSNTIAQQHYLPSSRYPTDRRPQDRQAVYNRMRHFPP